MVLELIKPGTNINFLKYRKLAYLASAAIIVAGFISLAMHGGPRLGVDFSGGLSIQVRFAKAIDVKEITKAVDGVGLDSVVVQRFGKDDANEYLIRASESDAHQESIRAAVEAALAKNLPDSGFEVQRLEMVGPKVGADLREKALQAIFYAVLLIATYISGRFEQKWMVAGLMAAGLASVVYVLELLSAPMSLSVIVATVAALILCVVLRLKYALGAIVALIHDVMIPLGVFSIFNKDVDLTIIAALLTIVGYSLNDTIIIYDRIRENIRAKVSPSLDVVINKSVNQTMSRTLITAGTTFLAVGSLYIFGGGVIHDFALTMLIGVVAGTYSSVFVGAPILAFFKPRIDTDDHAATATA